ncbi:unnamed protein product [Rhizoctonia solani]|uniref:Uncharacterized protein n=2 Tax=Rhizoctonia solani TaxID=456999 RepID=A0A8H3DYZ0_9AGAM|nr:unnamed protein product [Rhizoctonia solani]
MHSGDTGSALKPKPNHFSLISSISYPSLSSQVPGHIFTNDAHLYTDMLFNMPRAPFSRIQRIAALDWARKLGASNVPTIQSFDEYESQGALSINNTRNGTLFRYSRLVVRLISSSRWYVKCYPGSSKYAIQDTEYKKYFAVDTNENNPYGAEEKDAAVLELQHQFQDFYLISLAGTGSCLRHPNIKMANGHTMVSFTNRDILQGGFWRFEKLSDDTGSSLNPNRITNSNANVDTNAAVASNTNNTSATGITGRTIAGADVPVRQTRNGPSTEDALFYTDALFNSRRTLFTRVQRRAILDWARRMGTTNVPTMESFDAYEKSLEADGPVGQNPHTR